VESQKYLEQLKLARSARSRQGGYVDCSQEVCGEEWSEGRVGEHLLLAANEDCLPTEDNAGHGPEPIPSITGSAQ
jgi:hypothetical protein